MYLGYSLELLGCQTLFLLYLEELFIGLALGG